MSFEQNDEILLITADEAGNWREEKVSVAGIRRMLSERFSPDYREQMNTLREVDDSIRSWSRALKDTVKELKKAFRAGRIIDVAILFARFNKHLHTVVDMGKDVEVFYERSLAEFEGGHELSDLSDIEELSGKTAGVIGDLARKYISKRIYNTEIKNRNLAIRRLISRAETVYKTIDTYLDEMKSAKKDGDIGKYVDYLRKISAKQVEFEKEFVPAYNRYLKRSIDLMKEREAAKPQHGEIKGDGPAPDIKFDVPGGDQAVSPAGQVNVPAADIMVPAPGVSVPQVAPSLPEEPRVEEEVAPVTQARPSLTEEQPPAVKEMPVSDVDPNVVVPENPAVKPPKSPKPKVRLSPKPINSSSSVIKEETDMLKVANEEFVKELTKLAEEHGDPKLIALALVNYAEAIEEDDLESSLKLMALAEGVLNA